MTHKQDDTLKDLNRREIAFPKDSIKEILPQFFRTEYPKLITLLDEYYHYQDDDSSPTRLINELFYNRDITQTDLDLLEYIEDELLLGQAYFEGFADKRASLPNTQTHCIVLRELSILLNSSLELSLVLTQKSYTQRNKYSN